MNNEQLAVENIWGLLGPEYLPSSRRTRTLGLGASVRAFNDLAVPSLGGIWYGKQLLLPTLGVAVAERARSEGIKVQNIEVANALEALACWLAFESNKWARDSRLRGNTKLQGKEESDFSFSRARQRNFYVTQPMRMAAVQALPGLGFVESESVRFNSFRCSEMGMIFIEEATKKYRPSNRSVVEHLLRWVRGESEELKTKGLRDALSPLNPVPTEVVPLLRERLIQGGAESYKEKERRCKALEWVEQIRVDESVSKSWDRKPKMIEDDHWHDLQSGTKFFAAREAAITVLNALEDFMGNQSGNQSYSLSKKIPDFLSPAMDALNRNAQIFLNIQHSDQDANKFCRECLSDNSSNVLRDLVARDTHVLRLFGNDVKPGPAFRGSTVDKSNEESEDQDSQDAGEIQLPEGISYRMRNLYRLNLDMHGELEGWLNPPTKNEDL